MRIALYNRWLHTLGGGERDVGGFAQVLQSDHEVELLTHQPIELARFESRLNLQLPDVQLRVLPDDPDHRSVIAASREYDLFCNFSYGDMFVPDARHNVLRVFFPRDEPVTESMASMLLDSGFYPPEQDGARDFVWTGAEARLRLVLPESLQGGSRGAMLRLRLHGWRPAGASPAVIALLSGDRILARRELPRTGAWIEWQVRLPHELLVEPELPLTIEASTFNSRELGIGDDFRNLGVALARVEVAPRNWLGRRGRTIVSVAPNGDTYRQMVTRRVAKDAAAYDRVWTISRFSQEWIRRRWGIASDVIYPPVDVETFVPVPKHPTILSVGRFFPGGHNKKHQPMIEAFKAMCDAGLERWEYHIAGGLDESAAEHCVYLDRLRTVATGYPIVFHVNRLFDELRALYGMAQLYWHAAGFDEDEERFPERLEHFGISTVEAMAAACVPLVYGKGGQVEIVEPGTSGVLWYTLSELQDQTGALIANAGLCAQMAEAARRRSRAFGLERFTRDVRDAVASVKPIHHGDTETRRY